MSAAQVETTEERAARRAERRETMRKIRKEREVKRRHVITLDDYVSWYVKEHHDENGFDSATTLVKDAVMYALRTGFLRNGAGLNEMEFAYKKHLRDLMDEELEMLRKDTKIEDEG